MGVKFKSKLSWASITSFALIVVCFSISTVSANTIYSSVMSNDTAIADFSSRPLVSVSMLLAGLFALTSLIAGLVSIIKFKERSVWVFVPVVISGLLVLMTVTELIFQH